MTDHQQHTEFTSSNNNSATGGDDNDDMNEIFQSLCDENVTGNCSIFFIYMLNHYVYYRCSTEFLAVMIEDLCGGICQGDQAEGKGNFCGNVDKN